MLQIFRGYWGVVSKSELLSIVQAGFFYRPDAFLLPNQQ